MENVPPSASQEMGFGQSTDSLRHYWHVVLERRWLVVTAFVSIVLLSAFYLFRATPIYQATTRVQINRESENVLNIKDVFSVDAREQDYLQTQYKNLQSRSLIDSVVEKLKLDKDPRYAKSLDPTMSVSRDITIAPIRLSRLVDIKVEHSDPKKAMLIANELATNFIEMNLDQKLKSSSDAVVWLKAQAKDQEEKVQKAEELLQKYKIKFNEVSLEESENITRQGLVQAQTDLSKARGEAAQATQVIAEVQRKLKAGATLETIPEVNNNPTVQRLKQEIAIQDANLEALLKRYRHKHPTVIQATEQLARMRESLDDETRNVFESLKNAADLATVRERSLEGVVAEEQKKQMNLNQLRIQYDVLKRDAENNKLIYSNVLTRWKETELSSRIMSNNMRVVDAATMPLKPTKPRVMLTLFLGVFGGLGVALALAFFVNYLDDSIKSQDDVENYLRLPFLGYVPNIKSNSVIERDLQAHLHPQSNAAEGFRTIRATVALTHKLDKYQLLAVTSTIPSEGKSLVASNYAIVTAQTGVKTLLVDADLRRPSVHKAYQLHSPVGLSSFLTGDTNSFAEMVHTTEVPNLDVICCGAVPSTPSELIGSDRMIEFLKQARSRYDRVVLDCPPISAVSDPLVIAAMSDGVIFVTKFNKIRREHARKSVQRVQNAGIQILGTVLNDIDFEGKDSYYYSYYYYQNRYYATHYKTGAAKNKAGKPELDKAPKDVTKV
jgi:succinoglycan biosynthesis transport protein ExoP